MLLSYRRKYFINNNERPDRNVNVAYHLGPASPSPATRSILPELTPGGTLTLMFFLICICSSPLQLVQYSDMTSSSPPQLGHTET